MNRYDKKYVIMLDTWLEVFSDMWPIQVYRSTLDAIRKVGQIKGNYSLVQRDDYSAELRENKDLVDSKTGVLYKGGIYFFEKKGRD